MNLTAAILAGYLAFTGMTAPVLARRHPVTRPAPASYILHATTNEAIRYTNHGQEAETVRTCVEQTSQCIDDVLAPGQSMTRSSPGSNLEIYASTPTEIRGVHDALATSTMTTDLQVLPIMDASQTLQVYARAPGEATIKLLGSNGVQEDIGTYVLVPGTNTITPNLASPRIGEQYHLTTSVPSLTTMLLGGVAYRAKTLSSAVGDQFIVTADNDSTAWVKNIHADRILPAASNYFLADTDNTGVGNFVNANVLNWGLEVFRDMTVGKPEGGSVHLLSAFDSALHANIPFLAWSSDLVQERGATANDSPVDNGYRYFTISLNQLPVDGKVRVLNASADGPVTGIITGYNDNGEETGSMEYNLPTHGNTTLDLTPLHASRITLSANNDPHGLGINVLVDALINGEHKGGWQIEKPQPKVTGEEVVEMYLDPLHQSGYYLDNTTVRCMINGNCGVPSLVPQWADTYTRGTGEIWSEPTFENWLREMADGVTNASNIELWTHGDPYGWDARGTSGYSITKSQTTHTAEPGTIKLSATDTQHIWQLNRDFLVKYIDAHPERFGGNTTTGPSMDARYYTFTTTDPN